HCRGPRPPEPPRRGKRVTGRPSSGDRGGDFPCRLEYEGCVIGQALIQGDVGGGGGDGQPERELAQGRSAGRFHFAGSAGGLDRFVLHAQPLTVPKSSSSVSRRLPAARRAAARIPFAWPRWRRFSRPT